MNRRLQSLVLSILVSIPSVAGFALGADEGERLAGLPQTAYHLRIVRLAGALTPPDTALGLGEQGELVLPEAEVWGTPAQIEALRQHFGASEATALAGLYFAVGAGEPARLARRIYYREGELDLEFAAEYDETGDRHEITLSLAGESEPALLEARARVLTSRSVALAAPDSVGGGWLVIAVTPLDTERVRKQIESRGRIHLPGLDGVEEPELLSSTEPAYPITARKRKLQGRVVLNVLLDETGVPRALEVLDLPGGDAEFAGAVVEAVRQWRYRPAMKDGRAVPCHITIVTRFELE